jgi:hypothetical protein
VPRFVRLFRYPRIQPPSTYYCWSSGWCDLQTSYFEVSGGDLLESQTDLHLVSLFSQCVYGLFLKSAYTLPVVDKRLIGRKFGRNFGSLPHFGRVMTFASFQGAGKWLSRKQRLHVLNVQKVFLEDAGDIHLECHLNHRPFLISSTVFLSDVTGSELNKGAFINGSQQGLNCSLHLLPMVKVTQVVRCKMVL